ncbi:MAG: TonB-dependent receptor [Erythrobacter sp.]|uniref:TonB-dependent receptor n=1 Tax=Erythrobacter sp. TaxID=1042 RepID=UPI002638D503|nr:TonB-dependent receptor [Erythrobacter sp.]MDJ0979695.1 TonB-dependent receptor [Erythrobacter sp.]
MQDVPIAVTAFGADQLDEQKVRSLENLSFSAPNVQFEDVGTAPGFANFSIRGLGINSSIPSIDPTVGVFVDGVYMGISAGILFDTFDLEGIEVLRGPQGLLFGRNVTGGAVVVRTKAPSDELRIDARLARESGPATIASASISGPLIEDTLSAKVAVFYNDDKGYFTNEFNGNNDFGASETLIMRGALKFTPTDTVEIIGRYEHGEVDGDGAVVSNFGLFPRESFRVSVDEEGLNDSGWDQASLEINIDTAFGDGVITNIAGYREYSATVISDIDSSPDFVFHADTFTGQSQFSNELRYAGTFGDFDVTAGLYYFEQDINYVERRRLFAGTLNVSGGGRQDQQTYGAFVSTDWHLTDTWTINAGFRLSHEVKDVLVANLSGDLCDPLVARTCSAYGFADKESWTDPTFKLGVQWQPTEQTQAYAFFARGFRSGGYNFRNGTTQFDPGPYDPEQQNAWEVGLKQDIGGIARVNLSLFQTDVSDLQREIIQPVLPLGTTQVIRNSADLRIRGVEAEAQLRIGEHLTLSGQLGYVDGDYQEVFFDLNADGVVDQADLDLSPPRLAPWTYGIAAAFEHEFRGGEGFSARLGYSHRDESFSNDANTGLLSMADMIDGNISVTSADARWTLSLYGRNLLNDQTEGNVSPLPFFPGSTFSSINRGRIVGLEIKFDY